MADVEALLIGWLAPTLNVRALTDTPNDLATVVASIPVVRVVRIGGPSHDDNPRFDMPTVGVDSFGPDRGAAIATAQAVDEALRETLPGTKVDGVSVTRVQTVTGPSWLPWDSTEVRRVYSSYRLYLKASRP